MKLKLPTPKPTESEREKDILKSQPPKSRIFSAALAKAKQRIDAERAKQVKDEISNRSILHGTGLTKKKLETMNTALNRQNEKASAEELPEMVPIDVSNLPTTLMSKDLVLDPDQQAAVNGVKKNQVACIVGSAGTGKTTVSKAVIASVVQQIPTIDLNAARVEAEKTETPQYAAAMCIVSFTGRAVQQIKRALPEDFHHCCQTIHACLGYAPTSEDKYDDDGLYEKTRMVFRPTFTGMNPLPYKLCVIDEAGMVPIYLFNELIDALPADCRIIMMGDINQLPPVQGRSVLGFAMTKWPTFTLTKLHRNAGIIAENAHRILNGKMPIQHEKKFQMLYCEEGSRGMLQYTKAVIQKLHKIGVFDPMRDALIVPKNKGMLGQEQINSDLVHYFNPIQREDGQAINPRIVITAGWDHPTLSVGDKVMLLKNDRKRNLTNGMTGVIKEIRPNEAYKGQTVEDSISRHLASDATFNLDSLETDAIAHYEQSQKDGHKEEDDPKSRQASHVTSVQFQNENEPVEFSTAGEYSSLTHAYAFTCHKSQGGEYPTVVIVMHSADSRMLTREWFYTAVTRAQERVILIMNLKGASSAIRNQAIKGKTIEEKVQSFIALQDKSDTTVPNLWEPKELEV